MPHPGKLMVIAGAGMALALLTGCGSNPKVGVLLPMTGEVSSYGEAMRRGIDLALENASKDGTQPANLEILWADDASDPEVAVREYRRLAGEGAKIVIAGTTSGIAKRLLPVIEDTNTVCLSPSASAPALTRDSKSFFRLFASDELEGRRAGLFLAEDMGKRSVVIATGDSEHARGIEPEFRHMYEKAHGGKVVGKTSLTSARWEQELADLVAAHDPESVYIIAYADATIQALKVLRDARFGGTICVTSAFYSGEVVNQHADLVEGVFFPQPAFDVDDERPLVKQFVATHRSRYGSEPDIYAAHAFDAMRLAIEVVRITPVFEAPEIKKSLSFGLKEFPGVTGVVQFDERGDVRHNPIMFIVKDGQVRNFERWMAEEKKRIRDRIRNLLQPGSAPAPTAS